MMASVGDRRSGSRPRRAAVRFAVLAALWAAGAPSGPATNPLQQATDKWRSARAQDLPLESYLRPLVAADSGFRADSSLGRDHLGPELRAVYDGLEPLLTPDLKLQFLGLSNDSL